MEAERIIDDQTRQEFLDASRRGEEHLKSGQIAVGARYDADLVIIQLSRGYTLSFHPKRAQVLADAAPEQLAEIEVSYPGAQHLFSAFG